MNGSSLTLDALRRLQQTLLSRVAARDPDNIRSVGFSPAQSSDDGPSVEARFDVACKRQRVSAIKRIEPIESVRLLDRPTRQYRELALPTRVREVGDLVATGVRISTPDDHATTSLVVRWSTVTPAPPRPDQSRPDDPRWRWGLATVSHLFVGRGADPNREQARVRRVAVCGNGPETIRSRVAVRGRIPGGPDIALVETGWDRLWLSGFVREIGSPPLVVVSSDDLERWVKTGTSGEFIGDKIAHSWQWQTFYPTLAVPGLGRLQQVIAYEISPDRNPTARPFGPGSSGGVVIAGGVVVGLQVAAMRPRYDVGYAQTLDVSLQWVRSRVRASALDVVAVC